MPRRCLGVPRDLLSNRPALVLFRRQARRLWRSDKCRLPHPLQNWHSNSGGYLPLRSTHSILIDTSVAWLLSQLIQLQFVSEPLGGRPTGSTVVARLASAISQ